MAKATWQKVKEMIGQIRTELDKQHFIIDVAYKLNQELNAATTGTRADLNIPAIATYWANEIYNHYLLNDFYLRATNVAYEIEYYSYLDLLEVNENSQKIDKATYIVDLMIESTDVKDGEEIDQWINTSGFEDIAEDIYVQSNHDILVDAGLLEVRKNRTIVKERYWRYANWIKMLRVYDQNFDPFLIFIVGPYSEYN